MAESKLEPVELRSAQKYAWMDACVPACLSACVCVYDCVCTHVLTCRLCTYIHVNICYPPGLSTNFGGEKRVGPNGPFGGPRCGAWPPALSTDFRLFWWR